MDSKTQFGIIMGIVGIILIFFRKQKYVFYIISFLSILEILTIYFLNKHNLQKKHRIMYKFGLYVILILLFLLIGKVFNISTLTKIVLLTRIGDALQQIVGKTFGKHKLGIISPNKTIEGYLGGLIIVFIARLLNVFPSFSLKYYFLLYVASICGDLFFSYLKRKVNIKDWSMIFKKHGGAIDLSNSSYFASLMYMILRMRQKMKIL